MPNGLGVYNSANRKIIYKGEYLDSMKHGRGV